MVGQTNETSGLGPLQAKQNDDGEGGGQEDGAYEGDSSARGGDRRAQQPTSLPGRIPEDLQHLLPQEHQIGGHV